MIDTFKEEHRGIAEVLDSIKQPSLYIPERDSFLCVLRKTLASHTKKEAKYFYKNFPGEEFKTIFDDNFNTVYFQVMDTIDSILESGSGYDGDIEFICNSLESRIILEETILSTIGEKNIEKAFNTDCKKLKNVIKVFFKNQHINSSGVVFTKYADIQDEEIKIFNKISRTPILILNINSRLLCLKESNDELWYSLFNLVEFLGYYGEYNEERYIVFYK
jgi:hypothetical protein